MASALRELVSKLGASQGAYSGLDLSNPQDAQAYLQRSGAGYSWPFSKEQSAYLAAQFAPGAGMADASGAMPAMPEYGQGLMSTAQSGQFNPSMRQNLQQGNYLEAALQGLGVAGDAAYAIPLVGAAVGSTLKAPRAISKFIDAVGASPLPGAPGRANIPGIGNVRIGASPEATRAAEQYSALSGIPYRPLTEYAEADPARGARIAREYELMQHSPKSKDVKRAYSQMIDETLGQYESMLSQGIKPYFIEGADPYDASPYMALMDIEKNKRLGVFPTTSGFGSGSGFDPRDNPLMAPTEFMISGRPALANDIFRAVHDYYGHYKPGAGFRASGEETAFQSHAGMYSPLARRALTSETRGQNSWLNYGPYGDKNRTATVKDTIFADQKTGLMPRWVTEEGSKTAADRSSRFLNALRQGTTGMEGALNPDGTVTLVHYSKQPIDRVDPAFYGTGLSGSTVSEMNRASAPNFVKPWYAGLETVDSPYKKERGLGPYRNEITVPGELLYDVGRDPEGLWRKGKVNSSEKRIADSNYSGYYYNHPELGHVAVMFDPFDVTRKYMFPLLGTGAAAAVATQAAGDKKSDEGDI